MQTKQDLSKVPPIFFYKSFARVPTLYDVPKTITVTGLREIEREELIEVIERIGPSSWAFLFRTDLNQPFGHSI